MRISDWSSDVCSSDLLAQVTQRIMADPAARPQSITYASDDFGLLKLLFDDGGGAYADQRGGVVMRWNSQWERPELWLFDFHHPPFPGETGAWAFGIARVCGLSFVFLAPCGRACGV